MGCQCQLVYSIPRACIDLDEYIPFVKIETKEEDLLLNVLGLLEYGFLYQAIFSNSEQTDFIDDEIV